LYDTHGTHDSVGAACCAGYDAAIWVLTDNEINLGISEFSIGLDVKYVIVVKYR